LSISATSSCVTGRALGDFLVFEEVRVDDLLITHS
jgi:hypothetical protein